MSGKTLTTIRFVPRDPGNIAEAMACAIVNSGTLEGGYIAMLQRAGFSAIDMVDHLDAAHRIAHRIAHPNPVLHCARPELQNLAGAIGSFVSLAREVA